MAGRLHSGHEQHFFCRKIFIFSKKHRFCVAQHFAEKSDSQRMLGMKSWQHDVALVHLQDWQFGLWCLFNLPRALFSTTLTYKKTYERIPKVVGKNIFKIFLFYKLNCTLLYQNWQKISVTVLDFWKNVYNRVQIGKKCEKRAKNMFLSPKCAFFYMLEGVHHSKT